MAATPLVFTFVHGTWADERSRKRRPFCERFISHVSESDHRELWPLGQQLQDSWPDAQFWLLRWSGRNSVRARLAAAAVLAQHARTIARTNPTTRHIVIGHSHGGNVICAAMRSARVAALIHGVVSLSTPFVSASPRRHYAYLFLTFCLACCPVSAFWLVDRSFGFAAAFTLAVASHLLSFLSRRRRSASARFLARIRTPREHERPPMLVVRSTGDEASFALATFQAISWVSLRMTVTFVRFLEWLGRWAPAARAQAAVTANEPTAGEVIHKILYDDPPKAKESPAPDPQLGWGDWLLEIIAAGLAVGIIGLIYSPGPGMWLYFFHFCAAASCLFSATFVVVAGLAGLFGPEFLWWAVHVQPTAEAAPGGNVFFFQVPRRVTGAGTTEQSEAEFFELAHSDSYREECVAERISTFVDEIRGLQTRPPR